MRSEELCRDTCRLVWWDLTVHVARNDKMWPFEVGDVDESPSSRPRKNIECPASTNWARKVHRTRRELLVYSTSDTYLMLWDHKTQKKKKKKTGQIMAIKFQVRLATRLPFVMTKLVGRAQHHRTRSARRILFHSQ